MRFLWAVFIVALLAGAALAQMAPSPAVGPQLDSQVEQARVGAIEAMARYQELRAQRLAQQLTAANTKVSELETKIGQLETKIGHCQQEEPPK